MSLEMLGTDTATWPVDLRNEFEKSVSIVREREGKRLGELMFKYRDTLGLTKSSIDFAIDKAMGSTEYKSGFAKLVVLNMMERGVGVVVTKASTERGQE